MRITMHTKVVLGLLTMNRDQHIKEYCEQLQGWQKAMQEYGEKMKTWANEGGHRKERPHEPEKPKDFQKEYDFLILMVEKNFLEIIDLDEKDFEKIVLNEFSWTSYFAQNSMVYRDAI